MALFAVVHETCLQARLHPGDDRLVDVSFALFATLYLGFIVEQFLSVNYGQPAFLRLGGIDQHPFHDALLSFPVHYTPVRGEQCQY